MRQMGAGQTLALALALAQAQGASHVHREGQWCSSMVRDGAPYKGGKILMQAKRNVSYHSPMALCRLNATTPKQGKKAQRNTTHNTTVSSWDVKKN